MGSYKIKRLQLPKKYVDILEKQNLHTCKDVLSLTVLELQSLLGIGVAEALKIQVEISRKCASEPCTVYDIYKNKKTLCINTFFPTSLHTLDILLQGGLLLGSVTELSGPPGVGKTQFSFLLSILATLPKSMGGLDGQVIYIDTESAFSAGSYYIVSSFEKKITRAGWLIFHEREERRLRKMAESRYPEFFKSGKAIQDLLQRIFVHKASSVYALKEIIPTIESEIIKKKVKLVIIDSIASLFRKEYGASVLQSVVERNNILLQQAAVLKDLAQTYDIVVFLTNQITSHSSDCDPTLAEYFCAEDNVDQNVRVSSDFSESSKQTTKKQRLQEGPNVEGVSPALGVTWSHCVNTRLIAQFVDSNVRQLIIAKSPVAPNAALKYLLNDAGIVLADGDIEYVNVAQSEKHNILTKYNFLNAEITGTGNIFSTDCPMEH